MPTLEQIKQEILYTWRINSPERYRKIKERDPKWLERCSANLAQMAMDEVKAETYPGDDPDMVWSDVRNILLHPLKWGKLERGADMTLIPEWMQEEEEAELEIEDWETEKAKAKERHEEYLKELESQGKLPETYTEYLKRQQKLKAQGNEIPLRQLTYMAYLEELEANGKQPLHHQTFMEYLEEQEALGKELQPEVLELLKKKH